MTSPFSEWAWSYIQRGFSVVPIAAGSKRPGCKGWSGADWSKYCREQADVEQIREWSRDPAAGIGLCCGYGGVITVDVDDARAYPAVREVFGERAAPTKKGMKGASGIFRDDTGLILPKKFSRPEGGHFVEILGPGNQTVLPPTIHPGDPSRGIPSPGPYKWVRGSLESLRATITKDDIARLGALLAPLMVRPEAEEAPQPAVDAKEILERLEKLSSFEQRRYRGMAEPFLNSVARNLGAKGVGGRNSGLYAAARSVGWATSAGYLSPSIAEAKLLSACNKNGLAKEKTQGDMKRSIRNGLNNPDGLPDLNAIPDKPEYIAKKQLWEKRQQERREWEQQNGRLGRCPRNPAYAVSEAAQAPL
jgi:hypothetical protein